MDVRVTNKSGKKGPVMSANGIKQTEKKMKFNKLRSSVSLFITLI